LGSIYEFNRREAMKKQFNVSIRTVLLAGFLLGLANAALAQTPAPAPAQSTPPAAADKDKIPASSSLSLDMPVAANPEEDAAFKTFNDVPQTDSKKRIELGEAFVAKYPTSRYLTPVYSSMTMAYVNINDVKKMEEIGDKEAALNPNDVQVLAILGQTIPRTVNGSTPNAGQEIAKAAKYSKRAIEITPTIPKPGNITDAQFDVAKNMTLAMAHSGLGLVDILTGKYTEAIPELETSLKIDPTPDPVNMYLLGLANQKASHFDDSVAAFTKCSNTDNPMQGACKNGVEESKKLATTQLSAPK
jgi:tetratricopeptide (TPR) repeat protein